MHFKAPKIKNKLETKKVLAFLGMAIFGGHNVCAKSIVEKVIVRIDEDYILLSDLERHYLDLKKAQSNSIEISKKDIIQGLIESKVLVLKARENKISISDAELESQIDMRIADMAQRLGGENKIEIYFNKSIMDLRNQLRSVLESQFLQEKQRDYIFSSLRITPLEVCTYYRDLEEQSRPYLETEFNYVEIYKEFLINDHDKQMIVDLFTNYRKSLESNFRNRSILEKFEHDLWLKYEKHIKFGVEVITIDDYKWFGDFLAAIISQRVNVLSLPLVGSKGIMIVRVLEKNKDYIKLEYLYLSFLDLFEYIDTLKVSLLDFVESLKLKESIYSEDDIKNKAESQGYKVKFWRRARLNSLPLELIYAFYDGVLTENSLCGPYIEGNSIDENGLIRILFFKTIIPSRYADLNTDLVELTHKYSVESKRSVIDKMMEQYKNEYDIITDKTFYDELV